MQKVFEDFNDRFQIMHGEMNTVLESLPAEALDWNPGVEMNSLAVLIVHLTGAARYWVGDVVMGESSQRVRDEEFKAKGWTTAALKERVDQTFEYIQGALEKLDRSQLEEMRISPRDLQPYSVVWALAHALEHTALHVGHIQITVQFWKIKQEKV